MGIFRELLAAAPGSAELLVQMGHCAQVQGQREDAIGCYRAAAAARPAFGDAYWSLANLKTHHFSADDIAAMRAGESAPDASPHDRLHLCFALGKALEDWGDFAASWQYYERGNALKHATLRYRPEITEGNARRQMEVCTAGFFAARSGLGIPDPDPILIVGLPRSGSTLVEQILASHSQVEGAGELADIQRIVQGFDAEMPDPGNPRYPRALADMSRDDYVDLGRRYLAQTRAYRRGKPFFIDKMPNNFRHIGLIHLMMPNARIIDVRREPMACCVANFKQLYARGQEWSYSIGDVARYYRSYLKLMRHWDEVLPGRILRIHYEDLIGDLEGSVRRLLGFCALDFEQACVEFHATVRSVTTASSEQVRLPLYRTSLDHWRRFEPWLAPLAQALGG
jgi:tetratricopeptide (TPR) repeat protein